MAKYQFETTGTEVAADCAASIKDKIVLITGVSPGGLGAVFALTIAKYAPRLLILAGRNVGKIEKTAEDISAVAPSVSTRILKLDLSSQRQVREAAREVNGYQEQIDVLVNNSGIMAPPFELTEDGIESQLATNHIGHFLFTNLIVNKIASSTDGKQVSRIVNVSSNGYRLSPVRFDDWNFDVCVILATALNYNFASDSRLRRTGKLTIRGSPMGKPRLPICYSPNLWRLKLAKEESYP
jgi:NAD(P)-dependent dehydrogenase (short-subunit alcohol dehydrogenase family)